MYLNLTDGNIYILPIALYFTITFYSGNLTQFFLLFSGNKLQVKPTANLGIGRYRFEYTYQLEAHSQSDSAWGILCEKGNISSINFEACKLFTSVI